MPSPQGNRRLGKPTPFAALNRTGPPAVPLLRSPTRSPRSLGKGDPLTPALPVAPLPRGAPTRVPLHLPSCRGRLYRLFTPSISFPSTSPSLPSLFYVLKKKNCFPCLLSPFHSIRTNQGKRSQRKSGGASPSPVRRLLSPR